LAIPTSPDTLLRRVKDTDHTSAPPPRFVGIDNWAWRKGRRYGTIVVDLERGGVIDLLPDRDAETVKAWLAAHPGVELISRDRGESYIQAVTEGAPQARAFGNGDEPSVDPPLRGPFIVATAPPGRPAVPGLYVASPSTAGAVIRFSTPRPG
jgi:hypothetical protein